jgi:hypothetical protein
MDGGGGWDMGLGWRRWDGERMEDLLDWDCGGLFWPSVEGEVGWEEQVVVRTSGDSVEERLEGKISFGRGGCFGGRDLGETG